ncbi:unnamed protein product [Urochloa decumbens]|uniref:Sodium/calcium exchanger membrane region domain-containing protein n=1 Tax=Urochloa decumbens TaxID=240449 RepID=A0ABC9DWE2_9POAL
MCSIRNRRSSILYFPNNDLNSSPSSSRWLGSTKDKSTSNPLPACLAPATAAYIRFIFNASPDHLPAVPGILSSDPLGCQCQCQTASHMTMCHESYGFLPCTTNVPGNLFLVLTYGFLVYKGATYLSEGSELLLEIMGPGLVGGLLLPILGALPEALIVLASGLSGSRDTAQHQVLTGMGLLAGSTVFLLTLLWGTCVVAGKCDLGPNRVAVDLQNTRGFSLTGTGVSTDLKTTYLARIMAISVVPFVIAGFPNMMKINHEQRLAVLLALILSFLLVLSYCLYQLYGGVTMKNTLCLGVFLALIYIRKLTWEFSSEVLMVLLVCVVMGLFTSFRSTFPLWTCLVAYTMHPLSLVVVYALAWADPGQELGGGMPQEKLSL